MRNTFQSCRTLQLSSGAWHRQPGPSPSIPRYFFPLAFSSAASGAEERSCPREAIWAAISLLFQNDGGEFRKGGIKDKCGFECWDQEFTDVNYNHKAFLGFLLDRKVNDDIKWLRRKKRNEICSICDAEVFKLKGKLGGPDFYKNQKFKFWVCFVNLKIKKKSYRNKLYLKHFIGVQKVFFVEKFSSAGHKEMVDLFQMIKVKLQIFGHMPKISIL